MSFITTELAFKDEMEACSFICENGGEILLFEKSVPMPAKWLASGKAGVLFETAKALAFRKVDIKGQI